MSLQGRLGCDGGTLTNETLDNPLHVGPSVWNGGDGQRQMHDRNSGAWNAGIGSHFQYFFHKLCASWMKHLTHLGSFISLLSHRKGQPNAEALRCRHRKCPSSRSEVIDTQEVVKRWSVVQMCRVKSMSRRQSATNRSALLARHGARYPYSWRRECSYPSSH